MAVGILAYGSLISNPGREIGPMIRKQLPMVTPFKVEFARKSKKRDFAPTLIPVDEGGAEVNATLLILDESVTKEAAREMLYHRETGKRDKYEHSLNPGKNKVVIETLPGAHGAKTILYTRIRANINPHDLTPEHLAEQAIASAESEAGLCGQDGISYLRDAKNAGISTPLMELYESQILKKTNAPTLDEAIKAVTARRNR